MRSLSSIAAACATVFVAGCATLTPDGGLESVATLTKTRVPQELVRRPELFAAVVPRTAAMDMLRFEQAPNGPPNVPEFGSIATPAGFEALREVSAYHQVKDRLRRRPRFRRKNLLGHRSCRMVP